MLIVVDNQYPFEMVHLMLHHSRIHVFEHFITPVLYKLLLTRAAELMNFSRCILRLFICVN